MEILGIIVVAICIIAIIGLVFMFFPKQSKINSIITFVMAIFMIILGIMIASSLPTNEMANMAVCILGVALSAVGTLLFIIKKSSIFIMKIFVIFSFITSIISFNL